MVGVIRATVGDPLQHAEHVGGGEHHAGDDADHPHNECRVRFGELEPAAHDEELPDKAVRAGKRQ